MKITPREKGETRWGESKMRKKVNPLLSPPEGLFFSSAFEEGGGGGLIEREGLKERGAYLI